jgi:SAM-dependent methyltransferase
VSFTVDPDAYDRYMGRYSRLLAPQLADFAGVSAGQRVLDVGCGPGALTAELVKRLGAAAVSAVDPSEPFVAATEKRHPGVDVRRAAAEQLPFRDAVFDVTLAQLVILLMENPTLGIEEMVRVTRKQGVVAASVWDYAGGRGPVSVLWDAARELDAEVVDESQFAGVRGGHLAELFDAAGLQEVEETAHSIRVEHPSFEGWWEPLTLGVGPAGSYVAGLDPARRAQVRERCREKLPSPPFLLTAHAWAARGFA